jgi:hypothetical protein
MRTFNELSLDEVSMDGFTIVNGEFFKKPIEPLLTIRDHSFTFNGAAYKALNLVNSIQLFVHITYRRILVTPASSDDQNSLLWLKNPDDLSSHSLECTSFARQLFQAYGWILKNAYRSTGRLVTTNNKVMLLFDFSNPEIIPQRMDKSRNE